MDTSSSPKSFKKDVCMIFRTLHTLLNNLECKIMEREESYKQKAQEEAFSRLVNAYLQAVSNSNPDLNSLMVIPRDFKKVDNFSGLRSNSSLNNWNKIEKLNTIFPFHNFSIDDNDQTNRQNTEITMDNEKEIDLSSSTNNGKSRAHQEDEQRQTNKPDEEKEEGEDNNNKKYKNVIRIKENCTTTSQVTNISQSNLSSMAEKDIPSPGKASSEISANMVKNPVSIVVPLDPRDFTNQEQPRGSLMSSASGNNEADLMDKYDDSDMEEEEENLDEEMKDSESTKNLEPATMTDTVSELLIKSTSSSSGFVPPVAKVLTNSPAICETEPKVKIFGTNFLQEALGSASPKDLASSPPRSSIRAAANTGNSKILPKIASSSSTSSDCNATSSKTVGEEGVIATDLSHRQLVVNLQDAKIKENRCPLCFQQFTQLNSLKRHLRSHTGERPFPCEYCEKRFVDRERLKVHLRIHTGEKPFSCSLCNRAFSQKSTVKRHMAVHTGLKPFHCSIENCNKKFGTRDNLKVHEKKSHNSPCANSDTAQFSSSSNSSGSEVIGLNEAKSMRILMDEGSVLTRLNLSVPRTFDPDRGLG